MPTLTPHNDWSDQDCMQLALKEGRRALPECLPNPPAGCVLLKNGQVIASGYTQPPAHRRLYARLGQAFGLPNAEVLRSPVGVLNQAAVSLG
ncbi:hypothetical protein [Acidovorax sp. Leaf73]|uniref:hypothetical protein n=1 Tax=Acidovorax sp. Leaf73 TaxID=2876566 RepID=UPI00351CFB9C